jgi:phosphate/phosphite/phosphonate ABC transporter binding protein
MTDDLPVTPSKPCFRLGILPWQREDEHDDLIKRYQPLLDWLESRTGYSFTAVSARTYTALIEMFVEGSVQFAYLSPLPYVLARQENPGIELLATELAWNAAGTQKTDTYCSYFLVLKSRTDLSGIEDLRGKHFGFVIRESGSSFQYPNAMLQARGIDYETFFGSHRFLGSHPKVTDAIASGDIDGGATWDFNWRKAVEKHGDIFKPIFTSMPIPNLCIAAHPSVPPEQRQLVRKALLEINPSVLSGTHADGFTARPDGFYDIVRLLCGVLKMQTAFLEETVRKRTEQLQQTVRSLELAKRQIEESEDRFRMLFEHSPDAIFIADPADSSVPLSIINCNEVAAQSSGHAREDLLGKSLHLLSPEASAGQNAEEFLKTLRKHGKAKLEIQRRRKDGSTFPVETSCCLMEIGGRPVVLAIDRDITERKQLEVQLVARALHDPLTGLPNRALFMDRLRHALERSRRHPEYVFAVAFLDLDKFKQINDTLGHKVGDELLIETGRRLQRALRLEDTVARLGGDEFTLVLENLRTYPELQRVAQRLQTDISQPISIQGHTVQTTASIGVACSLTEYPSAEEMLQDADRAMYRAKYNGKARFEILQEANSVE